MKEIKFEYGFQSQNGIVKKVYELSQIPRIAEICDIWNELPICYVRQYTGLKDINGKEIYEGDVVRCGYGMGIVVFNAGCFMVQWIDDKEATMEFLFSRDGKYARTDDELFEVIGNIHENPELLKDTQDE